MSGDGLLFLRFRCAAANDLKKSNLSASLSHFQAKFLGVLAAVSPKPLEP